MGKDWTGNKRSTFTQLGASNHTELERVDDDFYSTDPKAINGLFRHESFSDNIWECACGNGVLSKQMEKYGKKVRSSDLVDRGYGQSGVDFLRQTEPFDGDIITNPPYKYVTEFILKAIELTQDKVAMFVKLTTLESQDRYTRIFKPYPPSDIYVFVSRIRCLRNGDKEYDISSAVCYAWFVWKKNGGGTLPTIHWIPPSDLAELDEPSQTKLF